MELWNRLAGTVRLELTAADPEGVLNRLSAAGFSLWNIQRVGSLSVHLEILRSDRRGVTALAEKAGASVDPLGIRGVAVRVAGLLHRPLLIGCGMLLTVLTLLLPERILFVEVEGNETVPARRILEEAAACGLEFGASRRELRSEAIKNQLLEELPELEWAGVNTMGCRAVISVREREPEGDMEPETAFSLVAAADGIIEQVYLQRGTALCRPGQAVRAGEALISGTSELPGGVRVTGAQAEVYALTRRSVEAVCSTVVRRRGVPVREETRYRLIIGKKQINFYSDSGNLPATCDKITKTIPLRLPGGDALPVALVLERIVWYDSNEQMRTPEQCRQLLEEAAREALLGEFCAGTVLDSQSELTVENQQAVLYGSYACREMIARPGTVVFLEDDTSDDATNR